MATAMDDDVRLEAAVRKALTPSQSVNRRVGNAVGNTAGYGAIVLYFVSWVGPMVGAPEMSNETAAIIASVAGAAIARVLD